MTFNDIYAEIISSNESWVTHKSLAKRHAKEMTTDGSAYVDLDKTNYILALATSKLAATSYIDPQNN